MSAARDEIMRRIGQALGPGVAVPDVPRRYRGPRVDDSAVDRFCERVAEYRATVTRVAPADLADTVARLCRERGARRIAVPSGGPEAIEGVELVVDDPPLSPQALDALDGVLTGSALAIAETGTIVLDGGERSGRRALTLVPDWHVCVVEEGSIVAGVPDAVAALAQAAAEGRPITLVSGPSATSDIELDRVEGVHGPRTLDVLVLRPAA
ncbi:MAG TPA: LUD domain-containing protein [Solirubrobacteraceae bacterium]|nr:LUD domain-containing protein [Solirubrobacteraceae bacterium]